jgi:hypothetical protein
MDSIRDESARETYEAPTIEDMPVRAEEQLLAGCKQANAQPAPGRAGPLNFCFNCVTESSS